MPLIRACACALGLLVASPSQGSSLFDYGWGQADARVPMGQTAFNIWVHKHRPTVLLEPAAKTVFSGGGHYPDPVWRIVAEAFVSPIGCTISQVRPLSRAGAAWEATYTCPAGVDLIALAAAQRDSLKHGDPLRNLPTP